MKAGYVKRFSPVERLLHWVNAIGFFFLLATGLGGSPLSRPHGAPARVILPEMYGYKGVKWLTRMEFVAHQPTGYWEGLGYDQNAWVGRSNGYGT